METPSALLAGRDDDAVAVRLYGTLNAAPAPLLDEPAGSPNWHARIRLLFDRVVRRVWLPGDPGYWVSTDRGRRVHPGF